jgi:hypothetical protein
MSVGSDVSASSAGVQPFGYLGSGNIEFLGDVAAGRTATVTFKLIADPRTAPGSYVVPVTIEYKFQDVPQTMTTDVAVVVGRDASFYVDGLEAPIRMTAGGSATAKVEAVNSGTFAVSGVSMSLGGDGLNVTDGQLYVGELNQGDGDVLQSQIKAVSPGVHQLRFVLRYLDDFGRPRSVTRSTQVVVATGTASAPTPSDNSQPSIFKRLLSFIGGLFGLGS